jgi:hypothetical protein
MKNLQEVVESKDVQFGIYFRTVECKDLLDFLESAYNGQKWWNEEEELMYYKIGDNEDDDESIVFYLISGKAYQV